MSINSRIAITTPGKYSCINAGAIDLVVPLIQSDFSEVKLNALKVYTLILNDKISLYSFILIFFKLMTCLSEAPEGRKELLRYIAKVKFQFLTNLDSYEHSINFPLDI